MSRAIHLALINSNVLFLYPLETSENYRFSYVSRGYRKGKWTRNRLNWVVHAWIFQEKGWWCPAGNWMFKVNNRNTSTRCKICSKLIIKQPKRLQTIRLGPKIIVRLEEKNKRTKKSIITQVRMFTFLLQTSQFRCWTVTFQHK